MLLLLHQAERRVAGLSDLAVWGAGPGVTHQGLVELLRLLCSDTIAARRLSLNRRRHCGN